MNTLITYEEVAALIANPPLIAPHPNFTNLRNITRHILRALQHISCPQSNILGWAGLIMARAMYALLTPTLFQLPSDPGPLAIYYPTPTAIIINAGAPVLDAPGQPTCNVPPPIDRATQATINLRFSRTRNYWLSYLNIRQAVYNLLDDNIDNAFRVSNNPALVGWNLAMEVRDIFDQITSTYGRPTPAALLQNNMLFWSVYSPQNAPEVLFCRIKDCQEEQILGEDSYTAQQLLNDAVRLLLQCGLYTSD
jgi:hypothetical protein